MSKTQRNSELGSLKAKRINWDLVMHQPFNLQYFTVHLENQKGWQKQADSSDVDSLRGE